MPQTELYYWRHGPTGGIRRREVVYDEGADPADFEIVPPGDDWWPITAEEYAAEFAEHEKGRAAQREKDAVEVEEKKSALLEQARSVFAGAKVAMGEDAALALARTVDPTFKVTAEAAPGWEA